MLLIVRLNIFEFTPEWVGREEIILLIWLHLHQITEIAGHSFCLFLLFIFTSILQIAAIKYGTEAEL